MKTRRPFSLRRYSVWRWGDLRFQYEPHHWGVRVKVAYAFTDLQIGPFVLGWTHYGEGYRNLPYPFKEWRGGSRIIQGRLICALYFHPLDWGIGISGGYSAVRLEWGPFSALVEYRKRDEPC